MKATRKNKRSGFTLIELLTVIAILGLLISVLVPTIQIAQTTAKRGVARGDLSSIAKAYYGFATADGKSRNIAEGSDAKKGQANSPALYAEVLARYQDLTSAKLWYIDSDDAITGEIPTNVLSQIKDGTNQLNAVKPISWAVVVQASKNLTTNYPILWTRGLETSGKWKKESPWGEDGGHIAYGDGHVAWFKDLNLDKAFVNFKNGSETSSYQEAIGDNARVKEDN